MLRPVCRPISRPDGASAELQRAENHAATATGPPSRSRSTSNYVAAVCTTLQIGSRSAICTHLAAKHGLAEGWSDRPTLDGPAHGLTMKVALASVVPVQRFSSRSRDRSSLVDTAGSYRLRSDARSGPEAVFGPLGITLTSKGALSPPSGGAAEVQPASNRHAADTFTFAPSLAQSPPSPGAADDGDHADCRVAAIRSSAARVERVRFAAV